MRVGPNGVTRKDRELSPVGVLQCASFAFLLLFEANSLADARLGEIPDPEAMREYSTAEVERSKCCFPSQSQLK